MQPCSLLDIGKETVTCVIAASNAFTVGKPLRADLPSAIADWSSGGDGEESAVSQAVTADPSAEEVSASEARCAQ